MDGLGYRNWGNKNNTYDDDQSDASPPAYGSDSYGFSAEASPRAGRTNSNKAKTSGNVYDYSIEEDDDSYGSSPEPVKRKNSGGEKSTTFGVAALSNQPTRRKTTEERMREILERNDADKKAAKIENATNDTETNTWKSSWDDLLDGINSPEVSTREGESFIETPSLNAQKSIGNKGDQSPTDSSYGDFEISASDLEVNPFPYCSNLQIIIVYITSHQITVRTRFSIRLDFVAIVIVTFRSEQWLRGELLKKLLTA